MLSAGFSGADFLLFSVGVDVVDDVDDGCEFINVTFLPARAGLQ